MKGGDAVFLFIEQVNIVVCKNKSLKSERKNGDS